MWKNEFLFLGWNSLTGEPRYDTTNANRITPQNEINSSQILLSSSFVAILSNIHQCPWITHPSSSALLKRTTRHQPGWDEPLINFWLNAMKIRLPSFVMCLQLFFHYLFMSFHPHYLLKLLFSGRPCASQQYFAGGSAVEYKLRDTSRRIIVLSVFLHKNNISFRGWRASGGSGDYNLSAAWHNRHNDGMWLGEHQDKWISYGWTRSHFISSPIPLCLDIILFG